MILVIFSDSSKMDFQEFRQFLRPHIRINIIIWLVTAFTGGRKRGNRIYGKVTPTPNMNKKCRPRPSVPRSRPREVAEIVWRSQYLSALESRIFYEAETSRQAL